MLILLGILLSIVLGLFLGVITFALLGAWYGLFEIADDDEG